MFNRVKLMLAIALGRMLGSAPISLHRAAMDHNRTVDALRGPVSVDTPMRKPPPHLRRPRGIGSFLDGFAARIVGRSQIDRSRMHWGPNGAQERSRRVAQGRPTLWVGNDGLRYTFDSYGKTVPFYH